MWIKTAIATLCLVSCTWASQVLTQINTTPPNGEHQYAQLGIEVTDSPGIGVQVGVVSVNGPADHSGIRPGDYVMSINGNPIETPAELIAAVRAQNPGTEVTISVWRDGEEFEKKVILATPNERGHRLDRAWLGVTLEADGTVGAKVGQVIPGSPAATANIKPGDVIVAINDMKVASAKDLVNGIEALRSGDKITLTLAGDTENRLEVTLGAITTAPPLFSYRIPIPELDEMLPESFVPPPSWREEMSDLRRQLQELREALRGRGKGNPDLNGDAKESESLDPVPPLSDDVSGMDPVKALFQFVDDRYRDGSNQDRAYRRRPTYRYSYQYQPWYRYRYGYGPRPYPYSSYYGRSPGYRSFYPPYDRPYYRPGVQVYVGPYGFGYYYR